MLTRKLLINLLLIFFLLISFPLLWLYNQRLNYRSFLTLNTKFSISANSFSADELSSVQYVIKHLQNQGIPTTLNVDVKNPPEFGVMGRVIETPMGNVEVYEYSSQEDAAKAIKTDDENAENPADIYLYKNLLIYNVTGSAKLQSLIKELNVEKTD